MTRDDTSATNSTGSITVTTHTTTNGTVTTDSYSVSPSEMTADQAEAEMNEFLLQIAAEGDQVAAVEEERPVEEPADTDFEEVMEQFIEEVEAQPLPTTVEELRQAVVGKAASKPAKKKPTTKKKSYKRRSDAELQVRRNRQESRRPIALSKYTLSTDDVLVLGIGSSIRLLHRNGNVSMNTVINTDSGGIERFIAMDKNLNIMSRYCYRESYGIKHVHEKVYRNISTAKSIRNTESFFTIDKKKLFESKGEVISIKNVYGIDKNRVYKTALRIKKMFRVAKEFLTKMKEDVGEVYDQDLFEVIALIDSRDNYFCYSIDSIFPKTTIRNSRSASHYIGTMATRLVGRKYYSGATTLNFNLYGHRVSWTAEDAPRQYTHSHLGSGRRYYNEFCTGSGDIFDGVDPNDPTKEEIQGLILRLGAFVAWESLEGGPYQTFANVGRYSVAGIRKVKDSYHSSMHMNRRDIGLMRSLPFDKIQDAFKLVKDRGELKYVLDEKELIELTAIALRGVEELKTSAMIYDLNKEWFYEDLSIAYGRRTRPQSLTRSSATAAVSDVLSIVPSTYINGKLIEAYHDPNDPAIQSEEERKKEEEERKKADSFLIQTINHNTIMKIGYTYLYYMNKQLRDVKKQEQKQEQEPESRKEPEVSGSNNSASSSKNS